MSGLISASTAGTLLTPLHSVSVILSVTENKQHTTIKAISGCYIFCNNVAETSFTNYGVGWDF